MNRWYRRYVGTVSDPKLAEAALIAECSRSIVIATWDAILESAAETNDEGRFRLSPRNVAATLQEQVATVERVFAALHELELIENGSVSAWQKRQYQSDSSTQRSRKHRAAKNKSNEINARQHVQRCATLHDRCATPPDTETDAEVDTALAVSTDAERESDDALEGAPIAFAGEWIEIDRKQYDAIVADYGYLEFPRDLTQADKYLATLNANVTPQPAMAERIRRVRGHLAAKNAEHKQLFAKMTAKATRKAMKLAPEADVLPFKVTTAMHVKPAPEPEYDGRWAAGGANA